MNVKATDHLQKMAMEMKIPTDILKQAYDIFSEHALWPSKRRNSRSETSIVEVAERGVLAQDALADILCKLTNVEGPEELPEGLLSSCFLTADANRNQVLNFAEFAVWFSRHGFNENVLLSEEQREIRKLARRHELPITTVEKYKSQFDAFDLDRSEKIEFDEFEKLLYVLLRIPKDLDLPPSRVRQFWLESGPNSDGALGFEEFLVFYSRHFSLTDSVCPVQEFYRGLRRVHVTPPRHH